MRKLFTLLFVFGILSSVQAQLPDGSVCPDFTGVDIDGNTWNLYDLLDEGKTVIIDVSATWCGPCWSYHETGALEDLYANYGPDGTDEIMVLWIEGDDSTNEDCIYDLPGCNSSTQGDWTVGTEYPIIDDGSIATLLQINYFPTIYQVCQNRIITEIGQPTADEIYAMIGDCTLPFGANNAGILAYNGESGNFCGELNFEPSVLVQNLGTSNLISATAELWVNSVLSETVNWTGDLSSWGTTDIVFANIIISENSTLEITITDVNGVSDEDESNNSYATTLNMASSTSDNYLTVEIFTDNYPSETTWEILSSSGNVLFSGGPYTSGSTLYTHATTLPADGCYEFNIYDTFGDGLIVGPGYYNVLDSDGNYVVEGSADYTFSANSPISIEGGMVVNDSGVLISYSGESGSICSEYSYSPVVTIQNQGSNQMTSALIEVSDGTNVILSQSWSGDIATSEVANVTLDLITITETTVLTFSLVEVNGVLVEDPASSAIETEFVQIITQSTTWTMELQVDTWAEEIYWQITNSNGDVVAFGGNEDVGADGGGTGLADPSSPGAYSSSELVYLEIELPNSTDCYDFLIVDSYGDGMVDGGGGYVLITDENNETIINNDYTTVNFENDHTLIVTNPAVSVSEFDNVTSFNVYPNPTKNSINARFELVNNMDINIEIFNIQGQSLINLNDHFTSGVNMIQTDISNLSEGVYYLRFSNGNKETTKRFVVIK